jgi:hypothetical protein
MAVTLSTANSFVTLIQMDAYFDTLFNRYATWDLIADADKNRMAVEATSIMVYQIDWAVTIDEDEPGATDEVAVRNACCELIWAINLEDRQLEADSKGVLKMKLDVLEIENDKFDRKNVIPAHVLNIIRDFTTGFTGGINIEMERE